jgi:PiT family inorganic phosphate transporter
LDISAGTLLFLLVALGIALAFEAVNGFHDTANAVATVIYTKSLRPWPAVVWSGLMNFLGVLLGGIAVAYSIVHLLPVEVLVRIDTGAGMAMVLALLVGAIAWNLGTWYLAIPASSSHTLIGAILGVGLANSWLTGQVGTGVNWRKAGEVGLSLLLSPLVGFCLAAAVLVLFKFLARDPALHAPPQGDRPPPWWVRGVLLLTCTGVSFAHGSNDGQKGVGLIMLILIGLVPAHFALNLHGPPEQFRAAAGAPARLLEVLDDPAVAAALSAAPPPGAAPSLGAETPREPLAYRPPAYQLVDPTLPQVQELLRGLRAHLEGKSSPRDLSPEARWEVRSQALLAEDGLRKLARRLAPALSPEKAAALKQARADLRGAVEYAPWWVLALVAVALGGGTMVGWKRIVVTVGEKIGKTHLTYAQGASAELVAMTTIGTADVLGLPVSTTQVLASGVAGTMAANRSGLQGRTVRSIALAWLLTLPASMLLAGALYLAFRRFV